MYINKAPGTESAPNKPTPPLYEALAFLSLTQASTCPSLGASRSPSGEGEDWSLLETCGPSCLLGWDAPFLAPRPTPARSSLGPGALPPPPIPGKG